MRTKPQVNKAIIYYMAAGFLLSMAVSCSVIPKKYPPEPFVYETNINIEGNLSKDEKSRLESELKSQLDDSIKVKTASGFLTEVLRHPPKYDSSKADQSVSYMRALLHSEGYLRDSITYDTTLTIKENHEPPQKRTTVNFDVYPGKLFKLDSISYNLSHPELQSLAKAEIKNSLLKKGEAFSKYTISNDLDRLVDVFRNNGYLRFNREELLGYWDTLDVRLLAPFIDPFEQIQLLQEQQKRWENPTVNLEIRLKPGFNNTPPVKYYVGNTIIYPDITSDTVGYTRKRVTVRPGTDVSYWRKTYKPKFLADNLYFKRGDLYNQNRFFKTISRFNSLGAWRLVNIEQIPRDSTDTVDFNVFLTPANKYSFAANIEGSRNSGLFLTEGSLLGVGGSVQLVNRNFGRTANQATTSFRYGTELGLDSSFVETRQVSLSHNIYFPKPIPNVKWIPERFRDNFRTVFSLAVANTERRNFFNLTSINASWGYDFQWQNNKGTKSHALYLKIPNIEFAYLNTRSKLDSLFITSPVYKYVFNQGFVFSVQSGWLMKWNKGKTNQLIRLNFEESGLLTGLIKNRIFDDLYRFIKIDGEYVRSIQLAKKELVFRTYAGVGVGLPTSTKKDSAVNLPFFKEFYAGGPNSMRAWGLRLLGPGSAVEYRSDVPLRFGDFQFETNIELRFPLTTIAGFKINSAFFTDIGNVWFIRKKNEFYPAGNLTSVRKFFKDLAVGSGMGLRIDFEFLILRLDYGIKIKNPSPEPPNIAGQNKWFYNFNPLNGILQLGINYPFRF